MRRSFSSRRVLTVAIVAMLIGGCVACRKGFFRLPRLSHPPSDAVMIITPYRQGGTWVFDDPAAKLRQEPFAAGIPEMMDAMVKHIPDADRGFRLLFSSQPFPGYTHKLIWRHGDKTGNWYYSEQYKKEAWFRHGLGKYYKEAPKEIYIKAEKR